MRRRVRAKERLLDSCLRLAWLLALGALLVSEDVPVRSARRQLKRGRSRCSRCGAAPS
jgi:hypothetical protein